MPENTYDSDYRYKPASNGSKLQSKSINSQLCSATQKTSSQLVSYVQSHRYNVIVAYFLSCSYLEQLTDYQASCATVDSVVQFSVFHFLSECWMSKLLIN